MNTPYLVDRRTFVTDLGRGALALAVLGVAACAPGAATGSPSGSAAPSVGAPGTAGPPGSPSATGDATPAGPAGLAWHRVNLGFVSAYILVRGGEAAIVDTGTGGSADAIGRALGSAGLDWSAVAHLVVTHHHADHAGSAAEVLALAPDAAGYAGAEDIPSIATPRPLTPVQDGDRVFDLEVVTAPGHTAGSICVLDVAAGVLVAGDALRSAAGRPTLPGAQFTDDMDLAIASVAKLGRLTFETLLVGHGDPVEGGASGLVAQLAARQ